MGVVNMSFWIEVVLNLIAFANTEERPGQVSFPGNRETIRCYVGTNTGIQGTTICPSWSTGCVKRTISLRNGDVEIQKLCGDEERRDLYYHEGCESSDVPFERKDCYCRTSLCNGSEMINSSLVFIGFMLLGMYFS